MSVTRITRALTLMTLLSLSASSIHGAPRRRPFYVSDTLAGAKLSDASNDAVRQDRRTGYRLSNSRECDGGHLSLTLKLGGSGASAESGEDSADVRVCRLPSLATGHGVAIGDTPQSVRQRLGMPTRVHWSRKKPGERIYSYHYVYRWRDGEVVTEYQAEYTFRNARLWAIELQEDVIEGG